MTDPFAADAPARTGWLVTLADLALLLAGFLVLVQATRPADRPALVQSMRERFGQPAPTDTPIAFQGTALTGFAPGSAAPLGREAARLAAWAREQLRDPRAGLTINGAADGTAADRDPATGSAALLAADRARAAAAVVAGAVPGARLSVSADAHPRGRAAWITVAFVGEQGK